MRDLRRPVAAALLAGAAMVPAHAATPAYAAGSQPPTECAIAIPPDAALWTWDSTWPDCGTCLAMGPFNAFGAPNWQCWPSLSLPGQYDLVVLL
jgi:hypothetical protein